MGAIAVSRFDTPLLTVVDKDKPGCWQPEKTHGRDGRDLGYFGPGSVTWKVALQNSILPATVATGAMFDLNPALASIGDISATYADPFGRARRTMEYTYAVSLGDKATALHATQRVNRIHDHIKGTWPVTGREYRASDPFNLMWLLVPFTQMQLDAYDAYGPRRLTPQERDQMWLEQTVTAELNRIPAHLVPQSQAEADDYFADMRPHLALNEQGARLTRALYMVPGDCELTPDVLAPLFRLGTESSVPLLPDYACRILGVGRSATATRAKRIAYRRMYRGLDSAPWTRDLASRTFGDKCRTLVRNARAELKAR